MGVCQTCRIAPVVVKCCHSATSCGDSACNGNCGENDVEHVGMVGVQALGTMLDRCPGSDPVGAIFEETLRELEPLERELMLFCATSNALAVRWLLHLGARWDARDANGSTCLHVACRAGSLQVIRELLEYECLLHIADESKWTPLHIAAFMGRRSVVQSVLEARAEPNATNLVGQTALDLCPDFGTLAAFKEGVGLEQQAEVVQVVGYKDSPRKLNDDNLSAQDECEYIPFFLPPIPAVRCGDSQEDLWRVGVSVFNQEPGYGLAFIVATGLATTYADALLKILQHSNVDRARLGDFLGEAMSLSFLTRLSLFDSIPLWNTGVVSALKCVFNVFQLPSDFQKIGRLLSGVAQVWWRKHSKILAMPESAATQLIETCGYELKYHLASADALSQLMFSTLLLHWLVHGDGLVETRELEHSAWMMLNRGLNVGGSDIPQIVQRPIYAEITRDFIPEFAMQVCFLDKELTLSTCPLKENTDVSSEQFLVRNQGPDAGAGLPAQVVWQSSLSHCATLEGWAQHRAVCVKETRRGVPSSVSEVPFSFTANKSFEQNSLDDLMNEAARTEANFLQPQTDEGVWLSICGSLLFFWGGAVDSRSKAPRMFMDLGRIRVDRLDDPSAHAASRTLVLVGATYRAPPRRFVREEAEVVEVLEVAPRSVEAEPFVKVVQILPDGRWQAIMLTRLELRMTTEADADTWTEFLSRPAQATLASRTAVQQTAKTTPAQEVAAEISETRDNVAPSGLVPVVSELTPRAVSWLMPSAEPTPRRDQLQPSKPPPPSRPPECERFFNA